MKRRESRRTALGAFWVFSSAGTLLGTTPNTPTAADLLPEEHVLAYATGIKTVLLKWEGDVPFFVSQTGNQWWPHREPMKAEHVGDRSHHTCPEVGDYCGINAYIVKSDRVSMALEGGLPICIKVALWGKVVVHEDGYRAQYAYPLHAYVVRHQMPFEFTKARLKEAYGIDTSPIVILGKEGGKP